MATPLLISLLLLVSTTTTTTTTTAAITTLSSDIAALKAIKSSIKPTTIPSYTCLYSWDFTSDPCAPPHVTHFLCGLSCSGNRVTQLTFDPAGYVGTLSPLVSKLTQLITIDLSDNKFSGPIPNSIFFLPNLQTLNLGLNSFSGLIPPSISNLKSIQTLDISHNLLSGSLPNTLASLTELTRLDLSFNKLTGPIPKLPKNIIQLALKGNSLNGYLQKPTFNELTQVEVVELSENSLTGTIPGWFFLIPSLQQVNLAKNSFTGVEILKPISSNLIAVDLGFNRIVGYPPANFSAYPMLASRAGPSTVRPVHRPRAAMGLGASYFQSNMYIPHYLGLARFIKKKKSLLDSRGGSGQAGSWGLPRLRLKLVITETSPRLPNGGDYGDVKPVSLLSHFHRPKTFDSTPRFKLLSHFRPSIVSHFLSRALVRLSSTAIVYFRRLATTREDRGEAATTVSHFPSRAASASRRGTSEQQVMANGYGCDFWDGENQMDKQIALEFLNVQLRPGHEK